MTKIYEFPKQEVIYLTEEVRRECLEYEALSNIVIVVCGLAGFLMWILFEYGVIK